jgi:hypothetical protein
LFAELAMRKLLPILAACVVLQSLSAAAAPLAFTTLDDPLGAKGTFARGISGSNIVGYYYDAGNIVHGFLFDGSTYTTLDDPLAPKSSSGQGTFPQAISGSTIVGTYGQSPSGLNNATGFVYNGSTYTKLNPGTGINQVRVNGVSGSTIVGSYPVGGIGAAFVYDGSTYATFRAPLAGTNRETVASDVSGSNIVGDYIDNAGATHAYLYDGASFTTLDDPAALANTFPGHPLTQYALGVSGSDVVGCYFPGLITAHSGALFVGYYYDGSSYTALQVGPNIPTVPAGVDGANVVGYYVDGAGLAHGFVVTVPEPSSLAVAAVGAACLAGVLVCRRVAKSWGNVSPAVRGGACRCR